MKIAEFRFVRLVAVGAAVLIIGAGCYSAMAQKADPLEPIRRMERRYRGAKTLQATFLERYTESGRTTRVESGVAYFRRPEKCGGSMRLPRTISF